MKLGISFATTVVGLIFACFLTHADVTVTTLVSFSGTNGAYLGANPYAELIQGIDGNFYGTTEAGGTNNLGTVFCMTPNGGLTTLISFGGTNGANPYGGLVQGGNRVLYGTTRNGGSNNLGTVFQITTNGVLTTLATFDGANGSAPLTGLLLASDGYLYGTTMTGGISNRGAIFQMSTNGGPLNVLVSFPGGTNGNAPEAALIQGIDGNLYGTTWAGGNLFQLKTNGYITNLFVFAAGTQPRGRLVQDTNGILYGTTYGGGTYNKGTAFKINTNGVLNTLFNFDGTNGANPYAGMILSADGNLYGTTTVGGGSPPIGAVFQLTTNGSFTPLYFLDYNTTNSTAPHGAYPYAELVEGANGNFYGSAELGGNGYGTIFRFSLQPVFQSITQTNSLLNLSWSAISNKMYQLSYKTNLNVGGWLNFGARVMATNGTMNTLDAPGTDAQRFYRIELLP
jgi:uncharacterized repeat protein (TIGR03803 family)